MNPAVSELLWFQWLEISRNLPLSIHVIQASLLKYHKVPSHFIFSGILTDDTAVAAFCVYVSFDIEGNHVQPFNKRQLRHISTRQEIRLLLHSD